MKETVFEGHAFVESAFRGAASEKAVCEQPRPEQSGHGDPGSENYILEESASGDSASGRCTSGTSASGECTSEESASGEPGRVSPECCGNVLEALTSEVSAFPSE